MLDEAPDATVAAILDRLNAALAAEDAEGTAALFEPDGFWRDLVAFTWNIRTMEGREEIATMLKDQLPAIQPRGFGITPGESAGDGGGFLQAWIDFETEAGRGHGHVRIRDGKIWTLLTTLRELKGAEERRGATRPKGVAHGADPDRKTWAEGRAEEAAKLGYETQPYVVIVGGGQGGIALGARLRQLDVPTVIVERNAPPGDSWRRRYKSLCLHDPVWYDHLPYLPFPANWPVFSPRDKIGDWLEMYTRVMELNYWTNTTCESARWDEATQAWEVRVRRDGEEIVLRPKQLVLATGMSGKPNIPQFPGQDDFRGEQHHSSQHPGPDAWKGKRAVVIGSNNSAHDIAAALWEAGADVTMVQRSTTHIVRSEPLMESLGALCSEEAVANGVTTDKADLIFASIPYRLAAGVPEAGLRQDPRGRRGLLRRAREGGLLARLGRRRHRALHEVSAARLGLLHRRGREPARHRRQDQAEDGPGGAADRERSGAERRHRPSRRPSGLRHRLRLDERLGGGADGGGGGRPGGQGLGARLGYHQGPGALGG